MEKVDNPSVVCKECNAEFTKRKNLYQHLRKIHQKSESQVSDEFKPVDKKFFCVKCFKTYATRPSLSRHKRTHEGDFRPAHRSRIKCPECTDSFRTSALLRAHLVNEHLMELYHENMVFKRETDFKAWKHEMERETFALYVLDTSAKACADGVQKLRYNCHRSHSFASKGSRRRRAKGTVKMGSCCPSCVILTIREDQYAVEFWKTHVGHDVEPRHEIAARLSQGVSAQHVLDDARNCDSGVQRTNLIQQKDLHNINHAFNIKYETTLKDCPDLEECPVVLYNDFGFQQHHESVHGYDVSSCSSVVAAKVDESVVTDNADQLSDATAEPSSVIKNKLEYLLALVEEGVTLSREEYESVFRKLDEIAEIFCGSEMRNEKVAEQVEEITKEPWDHEYSKTCFKRECVGQD